MTTTEEQNSNTNNLFGAIVNGSDSNTKDSEVASTTKRRHTAYQQNVSTKLRQLEASVQQLEDYWVTVDREEEEEEEEANNWDTDKDIIKVTVEALEALCAKSRLHEYGIVKVQY